MEIVQSPLEQAELIVIGVRKGDRRVAEPLSRPTANRERLTPRQIEVLRLAAAGRSNGEIAEALVLSERTVERHIADIYRKLGIGGRPARVALLAYALQWGLVDGRQEDW